MLLISQLLTYLFEYRTRAAWEQTMVWFKCQWFGVNIGFSDKVRILIENVYIFKGCVTKKLTK